MGYTVRLIGNKIEYIGAYSCADCGYVDDDRDFFYEVKGELYCSLHKNRA
ncbi:MAG: hypothetical protein ACO3QZ_05395 [Candidatus Nanopelagicaceae bacterium]